MNLSINYILCKYFSFDCKNVTVGSIILYLFLYVMGFGIVILFAAWFGAIVITLIPALNPELRISLDTPTGIDLDSNYTIVGVVTTIAYVYSSSTAYYLALYGLVLIVVIILLVGIIISLFNKLYLLSKIKITSCERRKEKYNE